MIKSLTVRLSASILASAMMLGSCVGSGAWATLSISETRQMWDRNADLWIWLLESDHAYYRNHVSGPAFLDALPDVRGKRGLDIGCGHGFVTRKVAAKGARMTGLDLSPKLVEYAREREAQEHGDTTYVEGDAMNLPFTDDSFDFATAFCSFMDLPDMDRALLEAMRVVRPGGFFQMTIMHPCFWLQDNEWVVSEDNKREAVVIRSYVEHESERVVEWYPEGLTKDDLGGMRPFQTALYRRTLADWINAISAAGFSIEFVEEPVPSVDLVEQYPTLDGSRVVPYFLMIRCRKAAT